MALWKIEA